MPKESRSRMQKWPSSTLCPPNSTVTGTTHFYPVAIRSARVICAQALSLNLAGGRGIDKSALFQFVCPDSEVLQLIRAERGDHGNVCGVAASRNQDSPDSGNVVAGVKDIPP